MSVTAIVQNDTIHLPKGAHFPDGTRVVIEPIHEPVEVSGKPIARCLAQFIGIADDLPTDMARNLDAYLHGHSKTT